MKGARRVRGFVEACRHITTHRTGDDFGSFPRRFRNNTSKRSRSCYITASSTHTKTHALSNTAFAAIVAQPCHYCGKVRLGRARAQPHAKVARGSHGVIPTPTLALSPILGPSLHHAYRMIRQPPSRTAHPTKRGCVLDA